MSAVDLARWQFAITTVYHFLFVPLTIGLSFFVAGLQTAWVRTGDAKYLRLTRFFGELFLINFALGVVTGIVQEFQFGMNWSAYILLAANSWMQHPVGYEFNAAAGRAELKDFLAVLLSNTAVITFFHTIVAAFLTTGAFVAGIAMWRLLRRRDQEDAPAFRGMARTGAWIVVVSAVLVLVTGDVQGKVMTEQQPMKMAAAEALYTTEQPASFSIFTIGSLDGSQEVFSIRIPHVLSFLATGDVNGKVEGINALQAQETAAYGPGDYRPYAPLTYWSFRLMIGMGALAVLAALWFLWAMRRGRTPGRLAVAAAIGLPFLPLLSNSLGWVFTEFGRQPWIVFGLMPTDAGVSPTGSALEVGLTMVGFTLLYGALAVVEVRLLLRRIRAGLPPAEAAGFEDEPSLALGY